MTTNVAAHHQLCFLCLGISVHVLLLFAIFDIYYSSPIVHGARNFPIAPSPDSPTPADRLVFFSADGLRARSFYEHPERSPYLHGLIHNGKAAWGISQSHVPTESRPGHVALMAGFHEDVSAVAHGWKYNPVPFDSTLNQSSQAFLWGSPDIVHLFSANTAKVRAEVYSAELEDFADADAAQLDRWVFRRVKDFLDSAKTDPMARTQLASPRSIHFLHLLGLDTIGHGYKPGSEQYLANIDTVDQGVREVVELFEAYFGDNRTAYIFTADHGMTDWGSHGDGTSDEVDTPLVAWGAGVEPSGPERIQLAQVDVAPLQSALLGMAIPANSFGTVPVEMLRASAKYKFRAAYANYKQMVEQYRMKRQERLSHSFRLFFTEAPLLNYDSLDQIEAKINELAQSNRYEAARKFCLKWIRPVHDALNYFHRYHRFSQGLAIAAVFCSWNLVLYASIIGESPLRPPLSLLQLYFPRRAFCASLLLIALLISLQHLPLPNYLYFLSPIFLCSIALNLFSGRSPQFEQIFWRNFVPFLAVPIWPKLPQMVVKLIFAGLSLALMVGVFFERSLLSILFVSISPFTLLTNRRNGKWRFGWPFLCLLLALFPQLPTVGGVPMPSAVLLSELAISFALRLYLSSSSSISHRSPLGILLIYRIHLFTSFLLLLTIITGSSTFIRPFAWCSLPLAFLLPFLTGSNLLMDRLITWIASLQLPFALLSLGHEALFLPLFSAFLLLYVRLEHQQLDNLAFLALEIGKKRKLQKGEFHPTSHLTAPEWLRALFLVASIEMAFFGTGNIASLNSFNPSFLRLFLSVFSPFTMASLLLLKVALPFLVLSLCFVASDQQKIGRLSALVGLITNTMAMVFFCCLRTDGSWLQIGISISNYVICVVCSAFVFLLLHLAKVLFQSGVIFI